MDYMKQVTTEIDRMVTMNHLKANFRGFKKCKTQTLKNSELDKKTFS